MGKPVAFDGPRGLVLLLQGVTRADVTCSDTTPELASLCAGQVPIALTSPRGCAAPDAFFDALPTQRLRDYGIELDRRSWSLRPDWQSDRAMLDSVAHRARGRADAVVLWFRDIGRAATRHGIGSDAHRQALRDADAEVRRAVQMFRLGERPPEVSLLFADPLSAAERSFDAASALAHALPRRSRRALEVRQTPSAMVVRSANCRDLEAVLDALRSAPFCDHGSLLATAQQPAFGRPARPNEIWFAPSPRVALGATGTRASARLFEEPGADQCAVVPWETTARSLHIGEVASLWSERLTSRLRYGAEQPARQPAQESAFPDLLSMLDADVAQALRQATQALTD